MAAANTASRTNRSVLTVAAANIAARTHPQAMRNTCLTNVARTDRPVQPVLTVPTVAAANTAPRTNRPVPSPRATASPRARRPRARSCQSSTFCCSHRDRRRVSVHAARTLSPTLWSVNAALNVHIRLGLTLTCSHRRRDRRHVDAAIQCVRSVRSVHGIHAARSVRSVNAAVNVRVIKASGQGFVRLLALGLLPLLVKVIAFARMPVIGVMSVAAAKANTAPRTNRPVLTVATANIAAMTDRPVQPILEGMQNERLQSGVVQNDGFPQNGGFVRDVVAASSHALIVSPVSL